MHPHAEAPSQNPSTDGDRTLFQRVFGDAEPDRHDDQSQTGDAVDGRTADSAQAEDQPYFDEQNANRPAAADRHRDTAIRPDEQPPDAVGYDLPHDEPQLDAAGDLYRDDDTGTAHDDVEPSAIDEPAQHDPVTDMTTDDTSTAGARAGAPTGPDEPTDLNSGDAPATAVASIWADGTVQDLRDRWHEAQLGFVDDPRKAADDTRNLVNEAVEALSAALASHREQLNSLPTNGDTEQYRMVVQRCRTFFERLLTV